MKIEVYVKTNKVGSREAEVIEVEDDSTDEEIDDAARQAMFNMIEWNWTRKGDAA